MAPIYGATSWFIIGSVSIQPSEFAKIFVILFLALVMSRMKNKSDREISRPTRLLILILIILVPVGLIVKQPDYGTATAFMFAFIAMLFMGGIDKKYIIAGIILVAIAVPVLYMYVLPEHAKSRINVFLNPELDPRGAGYNLTQSKLAIGAGGLLGMGYLKGNQTQLGFLYPKSTDFIFAVIGEELGVWGMALVIGLYALFLIRLLYIAREAKDFYGTLIVIGVIGMFAYQIIQNIGMTVALIPVTGVTLPFISYGGSSLLTSLANLGLVLNVSMRKKKINF